MRKKSVDPLVYGKVPPHAKELEMAVLGAMLLEYKCFDQVIEIIKSPEVFYVDAHQRIFKSIIALNRKAQPFDMLIVAEELKKMGELDLVGGPYFISQITDRVVSSANVENHARIIFEKYVKRQVIISGAEMMQDGYEDQGDAFEIIDRAEKAIDDITNNLYARKAKSISDIYVQEMIDLEERRGHQDILSGVPSGFSSVDFLTHGWQPSDLIILAARPSVGKTALCLNLARNAAVDRVKPTATLLFSLEMSSRQLIQRFMSSESGITLDRIKKGRLEDSDVQAMHQAKNMVALLKSNLFIDDSPTMNIFECRAKARRMKSVNNIGLIIIDYLQLMNGTGSEKSREQEIATISRNLKQLAKELDIPIIALSQLSRETEKRSDKKPQLSDLRESGAIEQDADAVIFMFRPEYYGLYTGKEGTSLLGETHLRWAKHRNGSCETVKLKANLEIQKFTEMDKQTTAFNVNKFDGKAAAANMYLPSNSHISIEDETDEDPF